MTPTQTPSSTSSVPSAPARRTWTTGRVLGLSVASAAVLAAGAMAVGAGFIHLVDEERRQGDYLTSDTIHVGSAGHAVTVEEIDLDGLSGDWLLGTARLRATGDGGQDVFVGVASVEDARDYLDDVDHSAVTDFDGGPDYDRRSGGAPSAPPAELNIWESQASGAGTQSVTWEPRGGDWTVVVMNADGSAGVDVSTDIGATAPILPKAVRWLAVASGVSAAAGLLGLLLVLLSARRRQAVGR